MWTLVPELPASKTATKLYCLVRERGRAADAEQTSIAASKANKTEPIRRSRPESAINTGKLLAINAWYDWISCHSCALFAVASPRSSIVASTFMAAFATHSLS